MSFRTGSALMACLLSPFVPAGDASAGVRYVDADATGAATGASWADAYPTIGPAVGASSSGDEVWVAEGLYVETVPVKPGVKLYGGFHGTETVLAERAGLYDTTILSGDVLQNDLPGFVNYGENLPVLLNSLPNVSASAVVDGFTVRHANGHAFDTPGNVKSSPTVRNCAFVENLSAQEGAAADVGPFSHPTFEDCSFVRNRAFRGGAAQSFGTNSGVTFRRCAFVDNRADFHGGALDLINLSSSLVECCVFTGNEAESGDGGAIFAGGIELVIRGSRFHGNRSENDGGAVATAASMKLVALSSVFSGNHCGATGGALLSHGGGNSRFVNLTVAGNSSGGSAGGMENRGNPTVANSVFWGNTAPSGTTEQQNFRSVFGTPSAFDANLVEGLVTTYGGTGNVAGVPMLVDLDGFDDVLGTADDDLRLADLSPCIDAGDTASAFLAGISLDADKQERFEENPAVPPNVPPPGTPQVDIGAYEWRDCNANAISDAVEAHLGTSMDGDGNGLLDECETICQKDLGYAGPGSTTIAVCGHLLSTGNASTFTLTAPATATAATILASTVFQPTFDPGLGAFLVPAPPWVAFTFPTSGGASLPVPGGFAASVFVQAASHGGAGVELSNALRIDFLP
ncbi:MAG: right-handed parallel beta-helix repeat-containing protein [Planctomycetota bacterium JB042]